MKLMYIHKAYLNSKGGVCVLDLTHDVKRALVDSKVQSGHINILSSGGSTGVILIENDPSLQTETIQYIQNQYEAASRDAVQRRSHTGANAYHMMALHVGLSLTLAFEGGRLLSSPFHEIKAFDFEPKAGRREFVISIVGQTQGGA